jgi:hypothetical protein
MTISDRTGDVEALLELLGEGRSCGAAIGELLAKRECVSGASLWHAVAALEELGLLRDAKTEAATWAPSARDRCLGTAWTLIGRKEERLARC